MLRSLFSNKKQSDADAKGANAVVQLEPEKPHDFLEEAVVLKLHPKPVVMTPTFTESQMAELEQQYWHNITFTNGAIKAQLPKSVVQFAPKSNSKNKGKTGQIPSGALDAKSSRPPNRARQTASRLAGNKLGLFTVVASSPDVSAAFHCAF